MTRATAVTPPKTVREATGAGDFRDASRDRWTLDFLTCQGEAVRDCLLAFNRTAKEACGGRALVGNFSGYFFGMTFPAEGWHLANDEILDSPFVDFQSSPVAYGTQFRGVGGTGQVRALVDSFRLRGKLCLLEADSRTHLEPPDGHVYVKNDAESLAVIARDMSAALVHGCGLWYFDFGHGWYTTPALREYLHGLGTFRDLKGDFGSAAEVAVVGDYDSVPFHATEAHPAPATAVGIDETIRELGFCGVAYDLLSFPDLSRANVRDYKVYVFLNLYHLDAGKRRILEQLKREGHTLVWVSTPGCPDGGVATVAETTGIACTLESRRTALKLKLAGGGEAKPNWTGASVASAVVAEDAQAQTWATVRTAEGKDRACIVSKVQAEGWRSVLCGVPYLPRELFLRLFAETGVHRYCTDAGAVVSANASVVALHAAKAGTYRLQAPKNVRWRRIYPDAEPSAGSPSLCREVRTSGPSTVIFKLEP